MARLSNPYAGLPGQVSKLLAAGALSALGSGLVFPFLVVYLTRIHHYGAGLATSAVAVAALAGLIGGIIVGLLIDHVSVRTGGLVTMTLAGVGAAGWAAIWSPLAAPFVAIVSGLGAGGLMTVWFSAFGAITPAPLRPRVFGLQFTNLNAMIGVGALIGALVTTSRSALAFQTLYAIDGVTYIACGVAIWSLLSSRAKAPRPASKPGLRAYREVLRDVRMRPILASGLLFFLLGYGQIEGTLPAYLISHGPLRPWMLGLAFAVNTGAVIVLQPIVLHRSSLLRPGRALAGTGFAWAATWLLVVLAGEVTGALVAALLVAMLLFACGEVLLAPVMPSLVNDVADESRRGTYNAAYGTATSVGQIAGAFAGSAAITAHVGAVYLTVIAACCVGFVPLSARLQRIQDELPAATIDPVPEGTAGAERPLEA